MFLEKSGISCRFLNSFVRLTSLWFIIHRVNFLSSLYPIKLDLQSILNLHEVGMNIRNVFLTSSSCQNLPAQEDPQRLKLQLPDGSALVLLWMVCPPSICLNLNVSQMHQTTWLPVNSWSPSLSSVWPCVFYLREHNFPLSPIPFIRYSPSATDFTLYFYKPSPSLPPPLHHLC